MCSQSQSFADSPSRGHSSSGNYGGGGSYSGYGSSSSRPAEPDVWTETLNAVSTTVEQNVKVAVSYASSLSSWASTLIANLDPTSLLFEEDEDYEGPVRYVQRTAQAASVRSEIVRTEVCRGIVGLST